MRTFFIWLVLLGSGLGIHTALTRPSPTGTATEAINILRDPIQQSLGKQAPISVTLDQGTVSLTPVARYRIAARMMSRQAYWWSPGTWNAKLSPYDLILVWEKFAEPDYDRFLRYTHDMRWFFYTFAPGGPADLADVRTHAANTHIIPATDNVLKAIKMIKKKQPVLLEGFLVNVVGTYADQPVSWMTSLSRTDDGRGACELLYVTHVTLNTRVYE